MEHERPGEMFGRYRVEGLLGNGGMGEVHRAHDTEHDRVVALKRLPAVVADPTATARFRRESRIAASLSGPHITPIYDYGEIDGRLYLAMRLVEGTDLADLLAEGPLAPARAVAILAQVAQALDTAHAAGVVHRDVKPSNILLEPGDTAFLADFGIAKSLAPDATRVTATRGEIGTLDYLAPERLMSAGSDQRADVYSLAGVLFECLTGKKPFPAEDSAGKLAAQLNTPPPAPSLYDWRIPHAMDLVVAAGMDKDPARRYPTAGELMAAARAALREQPATTPVSGPSTVPEVAPDPSRGRIVDAIVAVARARPGGDATRECPYPGLRSFAAAEAGLFFGREQAITEVLVRLSRQGPHTGPLLVVGASGTGKSSLLRAGVLPALAAAGEGREPWPQLVTTPGPDPIGALAARLAPLTGADPAGLANWLRARPADFGRLCARGNRLVLVVDQFEEVFTTADPMQREAFATLLASAWPALVVLGVRADFLDQCLRLPVLRPALASTCPLGPLTPAELERVIVEPAHAVGLEIEDGLVDRLITDVGATGGGYDTGALPRLAHALRQTWLNRADSVLTLRGYQATGGVDHAVALTADGVYSGLSEVDRELLRAALLRMVTVLDGGGVTRRKAARAQIPEHILARLVQARLVTAEADGVQLSHDALCTAWPRLWDWIEADRQGLLLRQHLDEAARHWREGGRDRGELYRGARLAATVDWSAGRGDLTDAEREFLRASKRAQQRDTRRLRTLVAGLAVFLVLAVVAGIVAVVKWQDAARAGSAAESRQRAAGSLADVAADPVGARRKALDAWHTRHTREARGALLSTVTHDFPVTLSSGLERAHSVDISPDGRLIAVGGEGGALRVFDADTGDQVGADLEGHHTVPVEVAFSPDAGMLASMGRGDRDGVRVWEMPSGRLLTTVRARSFLAWRPDSGALASLGFREGTGGDARAVGAWDPRTGEQSGWLTGSYQGNGHLPSDGAFSPDGTRLALGRTNGVVELWDPATASRVWQDVSYRDRELGADRRQRATPQIAMSDGLLAYASPDDGTIHFADARTGAPAGRPITVESTFGDLEFTADGGHLLTIHNAQAGLARWTVPLGGIDSYLAGPPESGDRRGLLVSAASASSGASVAVRADGRIVLWRNNPGRTFGPAAATHGVAVSPQGTEVTAAADDGIYVWHPDKGDVSRRPTPAVAFAVRYLPDGTRLVATMDGVVTVTRPDGTTDTERIDVEGIRAADLAVAPDGSRFAVSATGLSAGEEHTTVAVWDSATLTGQTLDLGSDTESGLAFSPDGETLHVAATAGDAIQTVTKIRRWRAAGRTELSSFPVDAPGAVALMPDGKSLVVAKRNQVEIRDARTGRTVRPAFGQFPAAVSSIAVSPQGRLLAVGMRNDPTIRLWDLTSSTQFATLTGHAGGTSDLEFAADGRSLVSTGGDQDVVRWPLDADATARRVCHDLAAAARKDLASLGCG